MASYTYPVKRPEGVLTAEQIHVLLSRPTVIAHRMAAITDQKFIADYLLQGAFAAVGGGIFYETGEEIFAADASEPVAPGAAYRKTVLTQGEIAAAKTDKRGLGTDILDEKIAREGMTFLNKALLRLGNSVIRDVDSTAMAVIASKVTSTATASAAWTTPGAVLETLVSQQNLRSEEGDGINLSTVALPSTKFAKLVGMLVDKNALPRETANIVLTGSLPFDALGFTWVTSPHIIGSDPMFIDRDQLGGVADEALGGPEWSRSGSFNVEVSSQRITGRDGYEVRARRVCVPVVTEPRAGLVITGTGL